MRVLVTGSNGHLGSNLVRALLARGVEVVPMVLPSTSTEGLDGLPVTPVPGNLLDERSLEAAAKGCDAIVNVAAVYKTRGRTAEEILEPAVAGVRNVLTVAARLGVKKVVHTSSIVACGYGDAPTPLRTEADWNERPHLPYYRAKTESERLAWKLAAELGVPLVVLCPCGMLGRHDYTLTPTTLLALQLASGGGATCVGGINYVDVRDVALAHALALEKGVPGERYIVGGENLTYRRFGELISAEAGVKVRHLPWPRAVTLAVARAQAAGVRLFGREPAVTPDEGDELVGRFGYFDTSKAERVLGYTPRRATELVTDTLRWLTFRHVLPAAVAERLRPRLPPDPQWLRPQS